MPAQTAVAAMYAAGQGTRQDWKEAAKWYRLSAEHGNVRAQIALAELYAKGRGVPQDLVQAYVWTSLSGQNAALKSLAEQMTPEQLAEAQRGVTDWKPKKGAHPLT